MGYYPPHYTDKALAALAHGLSGQPGSGVGVTSIRPGLFDYFLDQWGVDIRLEHFRYYDSIGLRNTVVISGFPAERNRDTTCFCPGERSRLFRDMYTPIWDNGENGTPVNDRNPYALYLWKAATTYKGLIKIWEVWNEPDLDTGNGWLTSGQPGNWWDHAPQPCETAIKAPPYHYIRAMRITYEVIKSVDPTAYVAVGGLGWPGFLDVICRYTDNPLNGTVDDINFPLTGGAYFDCMSFHAYPHLDNSLRLWRNDLNGFEYYRHSDAAMEGVWLKKNAFKAVLDKYGYDGARFPEKVWICTEFNIPRKSFGDFIGSDTAQVNFLIKTLVTAQMQGMAQMHVYSLCDEQPANNAPNEFAYMGLFQNPDGVPQTAPPNALAFALKTTSQVLLDSRYDPVRTLALKLTGKLRGGAFKNASGKYIYVLWAKTDQDGDETSIADFAFPAKYKPANGTLKYWDYSRTGFSRAIVSGKVPLTGSPVFLAEMP